MRGEPGQDLALEKLAVAATGIWIWCCQIRVIDYSVAKKGGSESRDKQSLVDTGLTAQWTRLTVVDDFQLDLSIGLVFGRTQDQGMLRRKEGRKRV